MKINEYNQMMSYLLRPAKNKKNFKDKNTKVAMSETPEEEAEIMLGSEAIEFLKWLKDHPNSTYNDWLKDKSASVKENKKDTNVIDLVPFLPTFEEEIKKLEEEEKNKEETREDFMKRRVREMQLVEADKFGIAKLLI